MKQIDVRVLETPKVLGCQRNTRAILNFLNWCIVIIKAFIDIIL